MNRDKELCGEKWARITESSEFPGTLKVSELLFTSRDGEEGNMLTIQPYGTVSGIVGIDPASGCIRSSTKEAWGIKAEAEAEALQC